MAITLTALKNELNSDPKSLGYSALDDFEAADKLNEAGASGETIEPAFVTAFQAQQEVVGSEYLTLTIGEQNLWNAILISVDSQGVPIKNAIIRGQVATIWGAGTTTRTNLVALQTRSASRAEVLFGEDVVVSMMDVHRARRI